MSDNKYFEIAKKAKDDEFYTQIDDIENELKHYREHFKGKHVFLNCDDPEHSNFWQFFYINFDFLDLKHLTATHYDDSKQTYRLDYFANDEGQMTFLQTDLEQNGDFRSPEALAILEECDIVVTNPPFSLFRDYINTLIDYEKDFLVIGNQNAITYKDIFPLLKDQKMWLGVNRGSFWFQVPEHYGKRATNVRIDDDGNKFIKNQGICWFTNLDYEERHKDLILYKPYNAEEYPNYVNYDGIEVGRVKDIPFDYDGHMGVPISFLHHFNPDQFEIIDISSALAKPMRDIAEKGEFMQGGPRFYIKEESGKHIYKRLFDRIIIKQK